ncbi:FAD:protein FMN transferase [Tamlana fucoidanivorans]|uniref:FAD:protein FMN transferase n=1 Tax=Allotamlana fucoidanivorans TaxID=2583814 RepID=A0A5C4SN24_9FLAO|nr:FAD:protein FMN transferase [Tamlana fucoidanivorans]TNJ44635.1 FAD:protein FMN transferase [Tamlana fucoidanivorans]
MRLINAYVGKHIFGILFVVILFSCEKQVKNTKLSGGVFGTGYSIIYDSSTDFSHQIDSLFYVINKSMSTYQQNSDISKVNRNEAVKVDAHFRHVFEASKIIYSETNGVFDPTIGAVVNAWDFGPEGKIVNLDSLKIDSLMHSVGFGKVKIVDSGIVKPKATFIDFNAIAKGYGVDVIGAFLELQDIDNYLVEIGGEIRVKGINAEKNMPWKVGVENPNFDGKQSILMAIALQDEAMATSGTYRKFKVDENGNRYAHIIDTQTGYPSKTNLLSISVIAETCMVADAYATAFKAMGIEKIKLFLERHPELKVFLIFENEQKDIETLALNGFPEAS